MGKKIISFVLLFLLIIIFTSSIIVSIFEFTVFKEDYIIQKFEESQYYSKIYNNIMEKFKDNTVQSGLEETILEGIITEKQIEDDTKIIIKNIYENTETKVNTEITKTRLKEKIDQIIQKNNKKVTAEEQEAINIYLNTIENIYEEGILYKPEYINIVKNVVTKIIQLCPIIIGIGFGISTVIILVIGLINKKESIKYYSILFISSGILLCVPKIMEMMHINTHNILLFNINFSKIVISTIENIFMSLVICGISMAIIGVGLNLFCGKSKNINE